MLYRLAVAALAALAVLSVPNTVNAQYRAPNWTGLYVGAHAGKAWTDFDVSSNDGFESQVLFPDRASVNPSTWAFGGFAGAQYQVGPVVFGVEADASRLNADGDAFFATDKYLKTEGADGTSWRDSFAIDNLYTVRGRLGYSLGSVMPYVTGGWAFANVDARHHVADGPNDPHAKASDSKTFNGYVIGGGAEWLIAPGVSLRGEYLYLDMGRETFAFDVGNKSGDPDLVSADMRGHVARVGITFRFNPTK